MGRKLRGKNVTQNANEKSGGGRLGWNIWKANGVTQNASEMAEVREIAKQVQRSKKARAWDAKGGGQRRSCEIARWMARLRGWRDGVTVALGRVWCRKMQRVLRQESAQSARERGRVASCKEGR